MPATPLCRLLTSVVTLGTMAFAQEAKPIFDGRLSLKPSKLTAAEEDLMKSRIIPAARKAWRERQRETACVSGPDARAIDVASGAFTRPGASQRAILYGYCEFGHNFDLDGIAIVEDGKLVSHIIFEGASNNAIGALPDINGDGLAEIVFATGGTNMGETWGTITVIVLSGTEVTSLGRLNIYSDNCGAVEDNCKAEASRISVKAGKAPAFFREKYVRKGDSGAWTKAGALAPAKPEDDETEYEVLK